MLHVLSPFQPPSDSTTFSENHNIQISMAPMEPPQQAGLSPLPTKLQESLVDCFFNTSLPSHLMPVSNSLQNLPSPIATLLGPQIQHLLHLSL